MTMRMAAVVAAIGLSLGLAACETVTPYQPLQPGTKVSGGYTDQKLDSDHFTVTFKGNTDTPRATVESYLLYRAAEITVAQGYDWFETVSRSTDRTDSTWVDPSTVRATPGVASGLTGASTVRAGGWGGWGPYGGFDVTTVQQYSATAEIALRHGPKPPGYARGLDAREVLTNLGPKIVRPTASLSQAPPPRG